MSSRTSARIKGFIAEGDLTALLNHFVKRGSSDQQIVACGANERAIGILMNEPEDGQRAEVAMPGGGGSLKISETVTAQQLLTCTAGSQGEVVDAADESISARAEEGGAANDVIEVYVMAGAKAHSAE